jgi:hypothetical protein
MLTMEVTTKVVVYADVLNDPAEIAGQIGCAFMKSSAVCSIHRLVVLGRGRWPGAGSAVMGK